MTYVITHTVSNISLTV